MIGALPMYDWPETQGANDILWERIAAELLAADIIAPVGLTRAADLPQLWLSPDLLLAQTCSFPLETILRGKVTYVATPSYAVAGCERPGYYRSVILSRGTNPDTPLPTGEAAILPEFPSNCRFAFNGEDSMSGFHCLKRDLEATGQKLPDLRVQTGAHRSSIIAVANGKADVCSVDCVTWDMAKTHEPASKKLNIIGWTKQRPALPLITSLHTSTHTLEALVAVAQKVLAAVVLENPVDLRIARFQ